MASFVRAERKCPSSPSAPAPSSSSHRPLCPIHNPPGPPVMANNKILELELEQDISLEFGRISIRNNSIVAAAAAASSTPPPKAPSPSSSAEADAAITPSRAPITFTTSSSSSATAPETEMAGAAEAVAAAVAAGLVDGKGRCTPCRQERLAARRYRWKVIVGLIFPFALQALDVTM